MPSTPSHQSIVYTRKQPPDRPRQQSFAVPAIPVANRKTRSQSITAPEQEAIDGRRKQAFVNRKDSIVGRGPKNPRRSLPITHNHIHTPEDYRSDSPDPLSLPYEPFHCESSIQSSISAASEISKPLTAVPLPRPIQRDSRSQTSSTLDPRDRDKFTEAPVGKSVAKPAQGTSRRQSLRLSGIAAPEEEDRPAVLELEGDTLKPVEEARSRRQSLRIQGQDPDCIAYDAQTSVVPDKASVGASTGRSPRENLSRPTAASSTSSRPSAESSGSKPARTLAPEALPASATRNLRSVSLSTRSATRAKLHVDIARPGPESSKDAVPPDKPKLGKGNSVQTPEPTHSGRRATRSLGQRFVPEVDLSRKIRARKAEASQAGTLSSGTGSKSIKREARPSVKQVDHYPTGPDEGAEQRPGKAEGTRRESGQLADKEVSDSEDEQDDANLEHTAPIEDTAVASNEDLIDPVFFESEQADSVKAVSEGDQRDRSFSDLPSVPCTAADTRQPLETIAVPVRLGIADLLNPYEPQQGIFTVGEPDVDNSTLATAVQEPACADLEAGTANNFADTSRPPDCHHATANKDCRDTVEATVKPLEPSVESDLEVNATDRAPGSDKYAVADSQDRKGPSNRDTENGVPASTNDSVPKGDVTPALANESDGSSRPPETYRRDLSPEQDNRAAASPPVTPSGAFESRLPSPDNEVEGWHPSELEKPADPAPFFSPPSGIGVVPVGFVPVVHPPAQSPTKTRSDPTETVVEVAEGAIGLEDLDEAQVDDSVTIDVGPSRESSLSSCPASAGQDAVKYEAYHDSSPLSSAPASQVPGLRESDLDSLLSTTSPFRTRSAHRSPSVRSVSNPNLTISSAIVIGTTLGGVALQEILPKAISFAEPVIGQSTDVPIRPTDETPLAQKQNSEGGLSSNNLSGLATSNHTDKAALAEFTATPSPPTSSTRLADILVRNSTSTSPIAPHCLVLPLKAENKVELGFAASLRTGSQGPSSSLSPVPSSALQRIIESLSPSGSGAGHLAIDSADQEDHQTSDEEEQEITEEYQSESEEEQETVESRNSRHFSHVQPDEYSRQRSQPPGDPINESDTPSPTPSALVTPVIPDEAIFEAQAISYPSEFSDRFDFANTGPPDRYPLDRGSSAVEKNRTAPLQLDNETERSSLRQIKRPRDSAQHEAGQGEDSDKKRRRPRLGLSDTSRATLHVGTATLPSVKLGSASHGLFGIAVGTSATETASLPEPEVIDLTEDHDDSPFRTPTAAPTTDFTGQKGSETPIAIDDSESHRSPTSSPVVITRRRKMPRKSNRVITSPPVSAGSSRPAHQRSDSGSSLSDAPPTSQPAPSSPSQGDAAAPAPTTKIKLKIGGSVVQTTSPAETVPEASDAPVQGRAGKKAGGAKRKEPANSVDATEATGRAAKKAKGRIAAEEDAAAPADDVDMEAARIPDAAPSKGKAVTKSKKAAPAPLKGGAKKGKPAGNPTVDDLIGDVLPSSPGEPAAATPVDSPAAATGQKRNSRARKGKAAQSETPDTGPDLSSSPSMHDTASAPDSPAALAQLQPHQQPTPVPPPHADPTPPASKLSSPIPATTGPSKASDLAKTALKKSAAVVKGKGKARASPADGDAGTSTGVKGEMDAKTPVRKALPGAGASASTGKKPITASTSAGALGTPKSGAKTGLTKSASAVGLGATATGSPAPGAGARPAPRQSLLAATLAKNTTPAVKVEDKQRADKKTPAGHKAAPPTDSRIPRHLAGPTEEELEEYAKSAAQRAKDKARRAEWKKSAVNLQAAKDCYRIDSRAPEDHAYVRRVGRESTTSLGLLRRLKAVWAQDDQMKARAEASPQADAVT